MCGRWEHFKTTHWYPVFCIQSSDSDGQRQRVYLQLLFQLVSKGNENCGFISKVVVDPGFARGLCKSQKEL